MRWRRSSLDEIVNAFHGVTCTKELPGRSLESYYYDRKMIASVLIV